MGSDGNKMSDGTSFQPSEPTMCVTGCGFFGTAATNNMCSKCYRDARIQEEQTASAKAVMDNIVNKNQFAFQPVVAASSSSSLSAGSDPVVTVSAVAPVVTVDAPAAPPAPNRCLTCNKKVGVMGWKCKCGSTFCGTHRYPEMHNCDFDYKSLGEKEIKKANPVVKSDKIDRI